MRVALAFAFCIGSAFFVFVAHPPGKAEVCAIYMSIPHTKNRIPFKGGLPRKKAELEAAALNASEMSSIRYVVLCERAY